MKSSLSETQNQSFFLSVADNTNYQKAKQAGHFPSGKSLYFLCVALCALFSLQCSSTLKSSSNQNSIENDILFYREYSFDRSQFGLSSTALHFWYPLTDVEQEVLSMRDPGRSGDPEALLMLSIFSSGTARNRTEYEIQKLFVTDFVNRYRSEIDQTPTIREKGRLLFLRMCTHFFRQHNPTKELTGYRLRQSSLTEIFRTGTFDCISASMLYMVLCRYFDLPVVAVQESDHVFMQIKTESENIDIELTSMFGYDIGYTRLKKTEAGKSWFTRRNIRSPRTTDHQNLTFLDPIGLICLALQSQHTAPDRMSTQDRNRLLEAIGFMEPNNPKSQKIALSVYNNEFRYLQSVSGYATAYKMFTHVSPRIGAINEITRNNKEVAQLLAWFKFQYACSMFKNQASQEGTQLLKEIIGEMDPLWPEYNLLFGNCINIINEHAQTLSSQNRFDQCMQFLDSLNCLPPIKGKLIDIYRSTNERWAQYYWKYENWKGAAEQYIKTLNFTYTEEDRKRIHLSIIAALKNEGHRFAIMEEWSKAIANYRLALEYAPGKEEYQSIKNSLNALYSSATATHSKTSQTNPTQITDSGDPDLVFPPSP